MESTHEGPTAAETLRFGIGESWLGPVLVAQATDGVCAVLFGDDRSALEQDLQGRFPGAALHEDPALPMLTTIISAIDAPGSAADLPLAARGTPFQQRVWQALHAIPAGTTASYATIAERIGQPGAVRAVAQACGANALAVIVPCHRVVRSDGGLSGYRWGTERKRALLAREAEQR